MLVVAVALLAAAAPAEARVDLAPETGTVRMAGTLDGFLTGPSSADPADIALGYVRANRAALGLDADDLDTFKLVRRYTSQSGMTHLVWAQQLDGIKAWGNDLHANVTRDGRLINVSGSPVADLAVRTTEPAVPKPRGKSAKLVLYTVKPGDTRLAWSVTHAKGSEVYEDVIDARSGRLLHRQNTVDSAQVSVNVWEYAPNIDVLGAGIPPAKAGDQQVKNTTITGAPITTDVGTALNGPYAHVYPDTDDNNVADSEIAPSSANVWSYPFTVFSPVGCPASFPQCSWNSGVANSWTTNRSQNATQAYYFVNNFHDWLAGNGIGFTAASGNFEAAGGDAVNVEVLNGANTASGFPSAGHKNIANMVTPSDGTPPRMQMYLFDGSLSGNAPMSNGADDASIVYHEYAHGLSNRLVTGGTGASTLNSFHAKAMGEGWSDYYALDYLLVQGLDIPDTTAPGEVVFGYYTAGGDVNSLRTEPLDCAVGNGAGECNGGATGHVGGYTLADMGKIRAGGPNIDADGEIWSQTLWQLRQTLGVPTARRLITDGMRLSPPDPSFIDMRNAIIQADTAVNGGANRAQIWQVFAARGMGANASVDCGTDATPTADFTTPAPGTGTLGGGPCPSPGGGTGGGTGGGAGGGGGGGAAIADKVAPRVTFALGSKQKLKTALAKGLKFAIRCNEACSVSVSMTIDAKTAKKLKLLKKKSKAKTFKVASGRLRIGTGSRTVTLKFPKKTAKRLRKLKSVKVSTTATVKDASGNAAKVTKKSTVKR